MLYCLVIESERIKMGTAQRLITEDMKKLVLVSKTKRR